MEADPLEVLKLGTYVGSCLGLGGLCAYSAVAAVLDANKRVLYARDQRGTVVARQLVAVSKDDRLVCFDVYPLSTNAALKRIFREYDAAFAAALGLPVYRPSREDEYDIEFVIASQWWDDYIDEAGANRGEEKPKKPLANRNRDPL
ncbi:MAG: hypothetical protein R2729_29470 [Bryobacteraceae bacterium]